jgi:hypothetical protein
MGCFTIACNECTVVYILESFSFSSRPAYVSIDLTTYCNCPFAMFEIDKYRLLVFFHLQLG